MAEEKGGDVSPLHTPDDDEKTGAEEEDFGAEAEDFADFAQFDDVPTDDDYVEVPQKKKKKKKPFRRRRPKKMIRAAWSVCKRVAERCHRVSTWFFATRQAMDGGMVVYKGSLLAEGGFSYVYLGYDAHGREIVLKEVRCDEQEQFDAVVREIQAHKRFSHKNLMPLLDACVLQMSSVKIALMAFPFCSRGSLRALINKKVIATWTQTQVSQKKWGRKKKNSNDDQGFFTTVETWSVVEFVNIFEGVCAGTAAIHKMGFSHRDIKPENVLLADDGTAVLMDFGSMAKAEVSLESRRDVLALQDEAAQNSTMPYRAPELWEPEVVGSLDATKADVWALGCLLWAMAFGYSPYEAEFPQNTSGIVTPNFVETSHLRVLAPLQSPPLEKLFHVKLSKNSHFYSAVERTARLLLVPNPSERPDSDRACALANHLLDSSDPDSNWATFDSPIPQP